MLIDNMLYRVKRTFYVRDMGTEQKRGIYDDGKNKSVVK